MKKKSIFLIIILVMLSGCSTKKEETKCETKKEIIEEYTIESNDSVITYNEESLSSNDLIKLYTNNNFEFLFNTIKTSLLEEEMKNYTKEATEYAEESIEQLKAYYGDELEEAIRSNTTNNNIEEYQETIKTSYLEEKYIKAYIKEQSKLKNIKDEDLEENYEKYYYKYYVSAITELFDKYNVIFQDTELNNQYKEYINELIIYMNEMSENNE